LSGASPYRSTQRVRPSSTAVSTKLLRVKRHQASSSGPMLGTPLITATRSPLRLLRNAGIKSGRRPEANVLVPAWSSTFALVRMQRSVILHPPHQFRTTNDLVKSKRTLDPLRNRSKINEADRYPVAHNGLVAGS